jgi:hypothetical protein
LLRRQLRGEFSALVATPARAAKVVLACALATGVLWPAAVAWADETPPPAPTPTTTTPEAPPPDPYSAPAKPSPSKPKSTPRPTTPVTHSAPVAPAPHYTPPVRHYTPPVQSQPSTPTYSAPTYTAPTYRAPTHRASTSRVRTHRAVRKAVHKPHKRVVHHRPKPKPAPVRVTLAPLAHVLAAAKSPLPVLPSSSGDGNDPYLWLAGLAFAVLAAAGLSLHLLSVRVSHMRFE